MTNVSRLLNVILAAVLAGAGAASSAPVPSTATTTTTSLENWAKRVGAASPEAFFAGGAYWIDGVGAASRFDPATSGAFRRGAFVSVEVDRTSPSVVDGEVIGAPTIRVTCAPPPNRPALALAFVQLTQLRGPSGTSREIAVSGSPMPGRGSKAAGVEVRLPLDRPGTYVLRSILVGSCANAAGQSELIVVPVLTSLRAP